MTNRSTGISFILISILFTLSSFADWPSYMADNSRSGVASGNIATPLALKWHYKSEFPPHPAWPPPAKNDYWHREMGLQPRLVYDRAFQIVATGGKAYFGSSADDAIHCIDLKTGTELWRSYAEGPIRLAPALANGKRRRGQAA